ncbi:ABC transporter ATP-binding protein [Candidatus Thorarchaeota archaeon]|nr:MAG: ABC transporter ATP-binding protein [Candidatus Thorarchaeota archaeon]
MQISDLTKTFGDVRAVDNISLEVRNGEIYGLLGPNGAGKTTTLKVIMGLLDPDSGTASVMGLNSLENPVEVKAVVGYVPEETVLYESLTPRELFEFIASVRELAKASISSRVAEIAKGLNFTEYMDKMIVTLSSGNKQKCLLMAALIHRPKLLILDEPFSGLDARVVRILKDAIQIHVDNGGSVLLSTHIMEVAQALCDRVGIIDHGKIIADGTLEELREQSKEESATLEQIFLKLTEQVDEVTEGVDNLREALSG